MSKHSSDAQLRQEIARRLKHAITLRGMTRTEAANALGVKRQTLWLYLKARATPGGEVLRRAFELWELKLELPGGVVITRESLGTAPRPQSIPQQMNLLDLLDNLEDGQLETTVIGRSGDYFELKIRIRPRVPAAT